jgi:hypothetical protein
MIEHLVTDAAFRAFERNGIYLAPDGSEWVEIKVVLDLSIESYDQYGQLIIDTDTADFRSSQNAILRKGGRLQVVGYDGKEWRLLSRRSDDGFIVTWAIERVDLTPTKELQALLQVEL